MPVSLQKCFKILNSIKQRYQGKCFEKMKRIIAFLLVVIVVPVSFGQEIRDQAEKTLPVVTLSEAEMEVFRVINDYRMSLGLPRIPLSLSLTFVAQNHAFDLAENNPVTDRCNLHSWSSEGSWKGCCYTDDHKQAKCMWEKPSELTNYTGNGYEIAFWTTKVFGDQKEIAVDALEVWKNSQPHHEVIINRGIWKQVSWMAMGVGIYKGYVLVWFGEEKDEEMQK
jgi:hypothetical protein